MEVTTEKVVCKYCASQHVVRYGSIGSNQRWKCKDCKKSYLGNDNLPRLKTATRQIIDALYLYCEGVPLSSIRRYIIVMYNSYPSTSTIYQWMIKFGRSIFQSARAYKPNVGRAWIAGATGLRICNRNAWVWDLIDAKTHFLLASNLSFTRTTNDARTLMLAAQKWTDKVPELVFTDSLSIYPESIELVWGSETKHMPSKKFIALTNNVVIDSLCELRRARSKLLIETKKIELVNLLLEGWEVHYNFFRPQRVLGDRTQAEVAGIKSPIMNLQRDLLIKSIKLNENS